MKPECDHGPGLVCNNCYTRKPGSEKAWTAKGHRVDPAKNFKAKPNWSNGPSK